MNSTFAPLLKQNGMPNHAIVDTGRNAVTGLRAECKCPTPSKTNVQAQLTDYS